MILSFKLYIFFKFQKQTKKDTFFWWNLIINLTKKIIQARLFFSGVVVFLGHGTTPWLSPIPLARLQSVWETDKKG